MSSSHNQPDNNVGPERKTAPPKQGLYDPQFEHDSCGVGFVVNMKGRKSHQLVTDALQILVNLIRNAKCACDESGRTDKQIVVRVSSTEEMVAVTISDNGVGIAAENLTRIFSHGFTTRKEGHGFGLHSAVLAAKEMGGSLIVLSEGPNQGAVFELELPLMLAKPG